LADIYKDDDTEIAIKIGPVVNLIHIYEIKISIAYLFHDSST